MIRFQKRFSDGAVLLTARCRAFAGEGVREHRILVDPDGTVRVWDDQANYYTTCHSLGESAQVKARKAAASLPSAA